jgi:hypothetical protein
MPVQSVQNSQAAAQSRAVAQAQSTEKLSNNQNNAVPVDKVTISAAAQAKQTASSIGANSGNGGK